MQSIGERLRKIRGEMSQLELAEKLGVHKNTLANYEKNERLPDVEVLNKLLDVFPDIEPGWLLTGVIEKQYPSAEGYIVPPRNEVGGRERGGAMIVSEQVVDYVSFRSDWVRYTLGIPAHYLSLISVKGDSMEPTLSDGDLVLIDLRANRVEDNAIYVIQSNDSLLVKRIQRKLDGSMVVRSDNPIYETEVLTGETADRLEVVGRVVWTGRKA